MYEQQCREVLEKVTNHPEIKQARLQEITLQELQQTIDSFPNGKAPDHDGVSHDLLKIMNEQNLKHLLAIMNSIIKNDNFSLPELLKSRFSLLHKGHGKDPLQIKNYRRITVSQTIQRLFDKILNERGYVQKVTDILEASQYGFLKGKSYEMPLLAVRIAISIAMERGLDLIIASFDARTFYPSCSPTIIMRENLMKETVGPAELKYENQTFKGRTSTLKEGQFLFGTIEEGQGLREGGVRSCYQSLLVQNITAGIIEKSGLGFKVEDKLYNYNLQADDIITMESTVEGMEAMIRLVEESSKIARIRQNVDKCGVLFISPRKEELKQKWESVMSNTDTLKIHCKEELEYLGTIITEKMNTKRNVIQKIEAADTAMIVIQATGFTTWRLLPAEDRVLLVKMFIIPKVIAGLNTMIVNQEEEHALIKFGTRLIRKCYHMGSSSPIAALHLMSGTMPLNIYLRLAVVNLFLRILATGDSPIREMVIDIGTGKIDLKSSWTVYVMKILKIHGCINPKELLQGANVTQANLNVIKRTYKKWITEDVFEKLLSKANEMPSSKYIDLNVCKPGKILETLKGGDTNNELRGGIYQAIMLAGGYLTDTKQDPEAVCEFCLRHPQKIEHYFWCSDIIQRYGWVWAEVIQLVEEPEMFQRCLINPRFRAQFLLNPEAAALCEFAIHRDQEGYRRIKELTRLYILYVHKARKRRRLEMTQQGMNLPPHRPPGVEKPELIPNKIKETWDSILKFNRIQKFPYPNLEIDSLEWKNNEIVQYQHLPIEVKKEWSRILSNRYRLQVNPTVPLYLNPQHQFRGLAHSNKQQDNHGLVPSNQQYHGLVLSNQQYHGLVFSNQQQHYHGWDPSNQQHQWIDPQQLGSYSQSIPLEYRIPPGMDSHLGTNYATMYPTYLWPQYNNFYLWPLMRSSPQWNNPYLLQDRWPL